jgi:GNAT superfamily N-acetyltransferase
MLIDNGPLVELTAIGVYGRHQHKGYASRALRMLTALCDENGIAISLIARPLPPDLSHMPGCPAKLSIDQLVAWYGRHGFVDATAPGDDTRVMVREPKGAVPHS